MQNEWFTNRFTVMQHRWQDNTASHAVFTQWQVKGLIFSEVHNIYKMQKSEIGRNLVKTKYITVFQKPLKIHVSIAVVMG